MKGYHCFTFTMLLLTAVISARPQNAVSSLSSDSAGSCATYFRLKLKNGQRIGNIFSRSISYAAPEITELVFRVSGTGIYIVTGSDEGHHYFDGIFRYDGRPVSTGKVGISEDGITASYNGKSYTNTDGSGLVFSSLIWGKPPAKLFPGLSWEVKIDQPWELGGAGVQTVRVLEMDPVNHSIKLKREGHGAGFFDNDRKELPVTTKEGKQLQMTISPGNCHWVGYTIFKDGLVISDELMVTRPVTLTADSVQIKAEQREYILLNEMPAED